MVDVGEVRPLTAKESLGGVLVSPPDAEMEMEIRAEPIASLMVHFS